MTPDENTDLYKGINKTGNITTLSSTHAFFAYY